MPFKDKALQAASKKRWAQRNPEKVREGWRRYQEANREKRRAQDRARYHANGEAKRAYHREWSRNNRAKDNERRSLAGKKLRKEIIDGYGGRCTCCGETHEEFLSVDHIYGDGSQEKREGKYGTPLYRWLRRNGFPKDRYRLLCMNCNWARGKWGYCPHERLLEKGSERVDGIQSPLFSRPPERP